MTEIKYGVRKVDTKEIMIYEKDESEAVELVAQINKEANKEILEVVKIITTQTIVSL